MSAGVPAGAAPDPSRVHPLATALVAGGAGLLSLLLAVAADPQASSLHHWLLPGALAVAAVVLFLLPRREIGLALLLLYLGLLDGYLKLKTVSPYATAGRDVLLLAILAGGAVQLLTSERRHELPPLFAWVGAFVGIALVELANPANRSLVHGLAALRPHLEFVPLFFLAFAVMRTKRRLRVFLVLLMAVAAANGVANYWQASHTPADLAGWGPGYEQRIYGTGAASGRTFLDVHGVERSRPLGLGSDLGFGGDVGLLAAPAVLAVAALARRRRIAILAPPLAVGTALAVVTSQQRSALIGSLVAIAAFAWLATARGQRFAPLVATGLTVLLLIGAAGAVAGSLGPGAFSRYSTIAPNRVFQTARASRRVTLEQVPQYVRRFPFGAGLGSVGPAAPLVTGTPFQQLSAETEFNFLLVELGVIGLIALLGLHLRVLWLAATHLRRRAEPELRVLLAAVAAPLAALVVIWFVHPTSASSPSAPYFWFAAGTLAYWTGRLARTDSARS